MGIALTLLWWLIPSTTSRPSTSVLFSSSPGAGTAYGAGSWWLRAFHKAGVWQDLLPPPQDDPNASKGRPKVPSGLTGTSLPLGQKKAVRTVFPGSRRGRMGPELRGRELSLAVQRCGQPETSRYREFMRWCPRVAAGCCLPPEGSSFGSGR